MVALLLEDLSDDDLAGEPDAIGRLDWRGSGNSEGPDDLVVGR
jgi:hypothetical protein